MLSSGLLEIITTGFVLLGCMALPLAVVFLVSAKNFAVRERLAIATLEQVIENLGEGFYRTSLDGKVLMTNPALVAISGFDSEAELIQNVGDGSSSWYVDQSRKAEFVKLVAENGKIQNFVSEIYRHKTRERIWISENARLVMDPVTGLPSHYEGTVIETTDIMVRMQEEQKLLKLTNHVPGGLFQMVRDPKGQFEVVFSSSGFRDMLDLRKKLNGFDVVHFVSLIHPEDLNAYYASLKMSRKSGRVWIQDFRVVTDGGKTKWLKVQATPEQMADKSTVWHGYLQDITATKADEAAIRNLAYNDALTKLPNRRSLIERMEQSIASCQRRNEFSALFFIDLDNFKTFNDTYGHDVGDLLLIEISRRLKHVVRRNDTVARLAGDEFVVLLDNLGATKVDAVEKASAIAEKIAESFRVPVQLGNLTQSATASIGGVTFSGDMTSVDEVLRLADAAMYDVKKSGRNAFKIFEEEQDLNFHGRTNFIADLNGLTKRNELELRFQPQLNRQGTICGAEALLRWNHPMLGLLTPDKFMHLAEKNGHIGEINAWVLSQALATLKDWRSGENTKKLRLSVNIGLQQFLSTALAGDIKLLARNLDVDLSKLTLELTEKMISKNRDGSPSLLKKLKQSGVRLSLDDFGVDFSSLSLLAEMPLDEIKIDGKFVKSMHNRPQDKALVKSILAMAEALGLSTVAEHVETQAQERLLLEFGCTNFQGFLYGGAMNLSDFEMAVVHNAAVASDQDSVEIAA
jgi:diguanylate cyclase (GGDEF)-like protein